MFDIINNPQFLADIGIDNASEEDKARLIAGIEDIAKERLTAKVADRITSEQAEEFGNITDEREAAEWLNANIPDFSSLVTEVFSEIRREIIAHKANVLGE